MTGFCAGGGGKRGHFGAESCEMIHKLLWNISCNRLWHSEVVSHWVRNSGKKIKKTTKFFWFLKLQWLYSTGNRIEGWKMLVPNPTLDIKYSQFSILFFFTNIFPISIWTLILSSSLRSSRFLFLERHPNQNFICIPHLLSFLLRVKLYKSKWLFIYLKLLK
jgi:hypothetical protein